MCRTSRSIRAISRAAPFLLLLAALLALIWFGRQQRAPRLYRLALVAPFEGIYSATGYSALPAVRSEVADWNKRLAPHHIQIQVWAVDDSDEPALAERRARELAADPLVLAVVGHMAPRASAAAAPTYHQAGLLQVSPVPIPVSLAGGPYACLSLGPSPSAINALSAASPGAPLLDLADPDTLENQVRATLAGPVLLPYPYCPSATGALLPQATAEAISSDAGLDGSPAAVTARAADLALRAINAAAVSASLDRESVAREAVNLAQDSGWTWDGSAWYPAGSARVVPCPHQ